ncbi:hypothetical protein H257_08876 [Aphanomyces astaci]|uniref:Uncharacterized protein n=1 Tax=Aphanomyces astaci TaxID=112090 RepID=W4GDW2_APHAT|nr:hypothetical protein H257_08876 [Aphanomyces astaci]ETV77461.1 hypothetical protein H257_08876 [Aphanomyces astaci]|eukprot:XP_009833248.1 hypothetical protein H257_08876 [Aphanomyces astaci]
MSIWNLPSWDECSESSTHDASSTPKSKEHASDSDACFSYLNVQSTTAGSIMHASKCSQLRQIHEKFESLRLQLDAERRPPPPQRWPPNQASQQLRRASPPVHTINTTASSLPPRQDASSFSTSTTLKPGAADTQHAQTQTIATSLHHLSSTHVGTTTSDMQPPPPPHVPTWVKEQEVPLNHFQDMWHDKVQALDDMLGTLSSQIQQQSDAAALTMYLAWLAGTMQAAVATLPLAKMTTWHDNSTTVTLSSNSPKVPANSAAATDMIEASLTTLVQDYRSLHSTHTAAMHHAKHTWSKKLHKAVHDTATTHAKWEHALATIHLLQDERNVLQTELHGALKRTAAVEKDLLTCQFKVSTLEQQCRDLHDQLRLQEIAWNDELAKAHPPPPTPPQATSFKSSSKNLDIPVVPLAITMTKKPIKVHEDCPETIWPEEAVQDEWWIDDGGNSDERGPPVPRPVNLPPPVAPREPPASTPHFGGRHHRQHQHISTHRHMLLEYLHKAASSKHPPPRRLKDQERGYESLAPGSK